MAVIVFADRYEVVRYIDGDESKRVVVATMRSKAKAHRLDNNPKTTETAKKLWNESQDRDNN